MEDQMKQKKIVIISILTIVLILVIAYFMISSAEKSKVDEFTFLMDVKVDKDIMGFNVDTDGLHFGRLAPGLTANRYLNISNTVDYPTELWLYKDNSTISKWVSFESIYLIQPGESKKIRIHIEVPKTAEVGMYNGTLSAVLKEHKT